MLFAGVNDGRLAWFENDGTPGGLGDWAEHVIDQTSWQPPYANGFLGIWDASNGTILDQARLHGAVVHVRVVGSKRSEASASIGIQTEGKAARIPSIRRRRSPWAAMPALRWVNSV